MISSCFRPVSFRALYEFVDLHQDGEAHGPGPCSRRFTSRSLLSQGEPQNFTSPKDVFLFGRGGNTNLRYNENGFGRGQKHQYIAVTELRLALHLINLLFKNEIQS